MASAVRIPQNRKMVSQPETVTVAPSELLSAQQRVEEINADEGRNDQPEQISATHIRSIPDTRASRMANITTPRSTATMSMPPSWRRARQGPIQERPAL